MLKAFLKRIQDLWDQQQYSFFCLSSEDSYLLERGAHRLKALAAPFYQVRLDGSQLKVEKLFQMLMISPLGFSRWVEIHSFEHMKGAELLKPLLKEQLPGTHVLFLCSKLDSRKKIIADLSQTVTQNLQESEKKSWILELGQEKGIPLDTLQKAIPILEHCEPWNLHRMDLELEKLLLAPLGLQKDLEAFQADTFLNAFFSKDFVKIYPTTLILGKDPGLALSMIGLLAWKIRQMRTSALSSSGWKAHQLNACEEHLLNLERQLKQSKTSLEGAWTDFLNACFH